MTSESPDLNLTACCWRTDITEHVFAPQEIITHIHMTNAPAVLRGFFRCLERTVFGVASAGESLQIARLVKTKD